ncbi:MAG: DNA polymerase III subunit gamma/tau [Acidobacteriales bacterium]|nr:DNA polymerase III subunit gamma/tau [Terriglobales bacterium]
MSYQVLARKYRPQNFSEVIGQDHVTRTLKNALSQGRTAHGYIFSGHRGIGKTTIARILAMALNCRAADHPATEPCGVCESCTEIRAGNAVDVIEIDAATNRGIDEIRELREGARYRPARDRFKIYILDEAHQITDAAFNALLKTLEEPPSHIVFMLATTQPEDIPQTIRSRCQHFSFRAVKFEQIMAQLRDLAGRENIPADEDALALLAEAGDGSMRDALSIMDQAIASSEGALTAEGVRQLIGAAPTGVLEQMMQAVFDGSSEAALHLVDNLVAEGHSPVHFARQLVRFLRNTLVAKVAGPESSLLQISSDERGRIARVAELFSEEDLTRHFQIMLRTHNELGYRQEQRFHLELGVLKMTHAQRLLPIEQLLSDAAPVGAPARSAPAASPARPVPSQPVPAKPPAVSPFAADSARKGGRTPEMASAPVVQSAAPVGTVTAAAAVMEVAAPAVEPVPAPTVALPSEDRVERVRDAVLQAIGQQRMLADLLGSGEWSIEGGEVVVRVANSAAVIDMSVSAEARRIASATASGVLGAATKFKVLPGAAPAAVGAPKKATGNGSGRSRAEQDPVVRKMQEKFGAEIRTIIDYREKR